jgi:FAD/FMN-containing dehydrogenase
LDRDLGSALRREFPARLVPKTFSVERYAHDAGMQWEEPSAVATPSDAAEVKALVAWCSRHDVPITARGAGSSIAGNALGSGLVIDFSRRMDRIGRFDKQRHEVTVEPGVVLLRLNRFLRRHGRRIGPSPSSEAFCTLGGMVGNNAAGSHSLYYGSTVENLAAVEIVGDGGERSVWTGPIRSPRDPRQRSLRRIARAFTSPWHEAAKNSSGYLLDRLESPEGFQPQRIFCGSEGTLGVVTSITLRTHPLPASVATALIGFDSTDDALRAVPRLLAHRPAAIELVDEDAVAVLRRRHPALPALASDAACSLVVDLFADGARELKTRTAALQQDLGRTAASFTVAHAARDRAALWTARRDVEPVLRELPGRRRPLPFVEDVVVPVDRQVAYVRALRRILAREGLHAPLYGHAGQGNLHVRPFVDLRRPAERQAMRRVNLQVARLARRLGGSLTGEHGDGYLRSGLLRRLFPTAYRSFQEIKRLFDPKDLFNPGKVVATRRTTREELFLDGPKYAPPPWL